MSLFVRQCVIIPVYNHGLTLGAVVRGAKQVLPVIVVNDGSTDQTAQVLRGINDVTVVTLPANQGKAAALKAGFARAEALGFTHAITLDADGQHPVESLPAFAEACQGHPEACIIGVRDLRSADAPFSRRLSNRLSTFWFRFETGTPLPDTLCGLRGYPLELVRSLHVTSRRYAYELEIIVKAAWAGFPLIAQPVSVDYRAPTSRLSHFRPWHDFLRVTRVHFRLSIQALSLPSSWRALLARDFPAALSPKRRFRTVLRLLHSRSP